MANQPETPIYRAGIYQFETTDVVEGGVGGIDNRPLLELADRTAYLKQHLDAAEATILDIENNIENIEDDLSIETLNRISADNALQALITTINRFIPKKRGWVTGINPGTGTVGDTFTVGGDIASCVLNARQFQANRYLITMSGTSIGTTNYKVNMASESMSSDANWVNDVNFREPLFKKISATQFYLIVDEDDSGFSQNIKVHFDVISLV